MAAPVTGSNNVDARGVVPPLEVLAELGLNVELADAEKRDGGILDLIANLDGKPGEKRQIVPDADGGVGIDLLATVANLDGKPGSKRDIATSTEADMTKRSGILDFIANLDGKPGSKR